MKKTTRALSGGVWLLQSTVVAILLASSLRSAAQVTNLTALDTSLQITLGGAGAGLSDWTVKGVNQLDYQWFYYSIGTSTLNSIDQIAPWTPASIIPSQPTPILTETYTGASQKVTTKYQLNGAQSAAGNAGLSTTLTFENLSGTNETIHLYQYSDFDLAGALGNQTVQFAGTASPYSVTQFGTAGGLLNGSIASVSGGTGDTVEEIAGIEDGTQFGLGNGNVPPSFSDSPLSATGAVQYAYEIDATLTPNQSIIVSELQTVPEPSTAALIFSGISAFGLYYGRKLVSFKKGVKKASL